MAKIELEGKIELVSSSQSGRNVSGVRINVSFGQRTAPMYMDRVTQIILDDVTANELKSKATALGINDLGELIGLEITLKIK